MNLKNYAHLFTLLLIPAFITGQNFVPVWNTPYNPMTFYVTGAILNTENLQPGDEVGIFDLDQYSGEEICVGSGILIQELINNEYLEIVASMDDGSNPSQSNGFTIGNDFIFKYHSQTHGLIENITFTFPYPGYNEDFSSQGTAMVNLDGTFQTGPYFEPVWSSPFNPMTFYVLSAQLNGLDLQAGSEVGIFDIDPNTNLEICVGAAILTGVITPENFLEIIASMDDGSLPDQANGFTPGNGFIFKYWDQANGVTQPVEFTFPYAGYDEVFAAQGSTIVDLTASTQPLEQQVISLQQGWTGVSSYLQPQNSSMQAICSPIQGELAIIQDLQNFYQPGASGNTLSDWNYKSGYFIKMEANSDLTITGLFPADKSITLNAGWNIVPVLSESAVNINDLFDGQMDKLIIVKEAIGTDAFWPEKQITALEVLLPGASYLVKMSQEATIIF